MLRILQSHTRRHLAKRRGNHLAREKRSVIAVQCAYRSRKARLAAAYKRVVRYIFLDTAIYNRAGSFLLFFPL